MAFKRDTHKLSHTDTHKLTHTHTHNREREEECDQCSVDRVTG